jgi:hypothetical protein
MDPNTNPPATPTPPNENPLPTSPVAPSSPSPTPEVSQPVSPVVAAIPPTPPSKSFFKRLPKAAWAGVVALLVIGGAAAFYFGYYANPTVVYNQSLKNTAKGYDKLVTYVEQQSKLETKAYTGDGTFKIKSNSFSTDGKISVKGSEKSGELKFDFGLAATRVDADIRFLKSASSNPDIYIRAEGIKGLGTVAGAPEMDAMLAKLDGTWIAIDHTLLDSFGGAVAGQAPASSEPPTEEQINDALKSLSKANQEYLFASGDKAVLKVVKNHGAETVDGHKTYHYQMTLNKANVKKYITAQKTALKSSKLNDWIKQNNYQDMVDATFDDIQQSANGIKESDTFDLWVDAKQRLIYKVRFVDEKNPVENYVDLGLDYTGGDKFPFFITGQSKEGSNKTTFTLVATLNTLDGNTDLKLTVKNTGAEAFDMNANFTLKPSKSAIKIEKPSGSKPLAEVLSEIGLGGYVEQLQALSGGAAPSPTAPPSGIDPSLFQ